MDKEQGQLNELFAISVKFRNMMLKYRPSKTVSTGEMHMMKVIDRCVQDKKRIHGDCLGITSSELSRLLMASKPSTSRMLSSLEEKNYVARISEDKDRRVVYICLTSLGEAILKEVAYSIEEIMMSVIEEIGEEEMGQFIQSFGKMYLILSEKLSLKDINY